VLKSAESSCGLFVDCVVCVACIDGSGMCSDVGSWSRSVLETIESLRVETVVEAGAGFFVEGVGPSSLLTSSPASEFASGAEKNGCLRILTVYETFLCSIEQNPALLEGVGVT
jgi:hypothetical protein